MNVRFNYDKDEFTTEELYEGTVILMEEITRLKTLAAAIYEEIDARLDIVDYMSLAGAAAREGKLITDEWLWEDWEDDPDRAL